MAVDEALLEGAGPEQAPTLRFYTWAEPTLSLGYFQEHEHRQAHSPSQCCTLVRRASGGGAILHHLELTYSYVVPMRSRFSDDPLFLYDTFHDSLIETLKEEWGVSAERYVPLASIGHVATPEPFLCFERRAAGDVICQGKKICGSAQRRGRSAVLQHGSVLLQQSPYTPELPGILELTGVLIPLNELWQRWAKRLALHLNAEFVPGVLSQEEREESQRIADQKFSSLDWTHRR